MKLDWRVCSRARLARDARFDGKFFIAVLSTRIYCRPICPARTSKESNVRYFPSAAAAAEHGFRPCLRCRPEYSPGTPAWAGTRNTVSRALQLIGESGLENGGVDGLADRLGVGARHLRRLFLRHLGATPSAVAHTRRLHFTKKLIDETRLPMGEVALAAGFGSVRRFNAGIRKVYHRTPTQLRRLAGRAAHLPQNQYVFRLHFRPPYNWTRILEFLAARATLGVEAVERGCYRRSIAFRGQSGYVETSLDDAKHALVARVHFADSRALFFIIERLRAMFDLNADWAVIAKTLRTDPELATRVDQEPGLRVPGCWSGFELAVRAILGQQVSVAAATSMAGQLAHEFGSPFVSCNGLTRLFPAPEVLADAALNRIWVPRAKAQTIRALARAVCDQQIRFEGVLDGDDFRARLCEISGIGKWTAEYVAMRALRDPDAFPTGDLALCSALADCSARELERHSQAWRPWRAYAALLLWQGRTERTVGDERKGETDRALGTIAGASALGETLDVGATEHPHRAVRAI
jgi:AraC family transcriptional regulator of adaptative response / DNA-3-methyladenine glycosylase II